MKRPTNPDVTPVDHVKVAIEAQMIANTVGEEAVAAAKRIATYLLEASRGIAIAQTATAATRVDYGYLRLTDEQNALVSNRLADIQKGLAHMQQMLHDQRQVAIGVIQTPLSTPNFPYHDPNPPPPPGQEDFPLPPTDSDQSGSSAGEPLPPYLGGPDPTPDTESGDA